MKVEGSQYRVNNSKGRNVHTSTYILCMYILGTSTAVSCVIVLFLILGLHTNKSKSGAWNPSFWRKEHVVAKRVSKPSFVLGCLCGCIVCPTTKNDSP